ncbi:MAG: hypothetical protein GF408_00670 [Candidatus Omnitrophica bacterium]|nr:hypothetical protein [Candidatus Omnitrophota bacterium]
MPGFDGTGPRGMGPMTGGGRGYCAVPAGQGYSRYPAGRPYGYGRGGGRGFRNRFYATGLYGWQRDIYAQRPPAREEAAILKAEAESLKAELEEIQDRLKAIEGENNE